MKNCTKCGILKPLSDFYKRFDTPSGVTTHCKCCTKINRAANYQDNKEKKKLQAREWYAANKQRKSENSKKWYQANRDDCLMKASVNGKIYRLNNDAAVKKRRSDWYQANRDEKLQKNKEWKYLNRHRLTAYAAKRRALIIKAMPEWVNLIDINHFYKERDRLTTETGIIHHVDHIVPLMGVSVCGLHVPWNLRVIPAVDNLKKGNCHVP